MKIPKSLAQHPAVDYVVSGDDQGADAKYWVFLKDGYYFTQGSKAGGCGGGAFDTVAEFNYSKLEYKRN